MSPNCRLPGGGGDEVGRGANYINDITMPICFLFFLSPRFLHDSTSNPVLLPALKTKQKQKKRGGQSIHSLPCLCLEENKQGEKTMWIGWPRRQRGAEIEGGNGQKTDRTEFSGRASQLPGVYKKKVV